MAKKSRMQSGTTGAFPKWRFVSFPNSVHVATLLGGRDVPDVIQSTYNAIVNLYRPIQKCTHFTFLGDTHFNELAKIGMAMRSRFIWRQIHQLLILAARLEAESAFRILETISWSLGTSNEIALALSARALIEHACAIDYLHFQLDGQAKRLQTDVWIVDEDEQQPCLTLKDRSIHRELLRFVVGRWTDPLDDVLPTTNDAVAWNQYYAGLQTTADDIPEDEKANVLKELINRQKSIGGRQQLRALYNRLSDFCHPNAASRALTFRLVRNPFGKRVTTPQPHSEFTVGFSEVFDLGRRSIKISCEMILAGLAQLAACRKPFKPIAPPDANVASIGSIPVVDEHGRLFHARLDTIDATVHPDKMIDLTPDQEERIRKICEMVEGTDCLTLEKSRDLFRMDTVYADEEIALWEHIASTFQRELADRDSTTLASRRLLLGTILNAVSHESLGTLISSRPEIKSIPNLERLFRRAKGIE